VSAAGRPSLILHIGQHKTGSKALQSFLAHNRRALRDQSMFYPVPDDPPPGARAYAVSHFRLFALIRREALAACSGPAAAGRYWERQGRFCLPYESARDFLAAMDASRRDGGWSRAILSAEDLFDMQTAHELEFSLDVVSAGADRLARLAAEFGLDVRVAVYLRRQDHLLAAHYAQFHKGSPDHDVEFAAFARAFAPRLDAHRILAPWVSAFGPDAVCVRPYERPEFPGGIVADFFAQVLNCPVPAACVAPPADAESVNRTPDRDVVEYLRGLNRRQVQGLAVVPRPLLLEAALRLDATGRGPAGIAAWLSPRARRELLATFADGNAAIARDLLRRADGRLFAEAPPEDDPGWSPYPGLTAARAAAISRAVRELRRPDA
jgi:hypothetical protein